MKLTPLTRPSARRLRRRNGQHRRCRSHRARLVLPGVRHRDARDHLGDIQKMSEADDWENYQTGPFCRHWYDPADCDHVCATCGHACAKHEVGNTTECFEFGCDCTEWKEQE